MKILVFGASGLTGSKLLDQLLERKHSVTAYVRNASKITRQDANLTVVEGRLDDESAMVKVMQGVDVVVSCLGSGTLKKSTVLATFAKQIQGAMTAAGVQRIIYMASAGIHNELSGVPGLIVKMILGRVLEDHLNAAKQFMNGKFTYTIARPVQLSDGPLTGHYLTAEKGVAGGKAISRADVAHFIVAACETNNYNNQSVGLSG